MFIPTAPSSFHGTWHFAHGLLCHTPPPSLFMVAFDILVTHSCDNKTGGLAAYNYVN